MAKKQSKGGLGKGLGALIPEASEDFIMDNISRSQSGSEGEGKILEVPIEEIKAGTSQPRRHFDPEAIAELAVSIKGHGLIQPLTVRRLESGAYELIAGERRLRAGKEAGLSKIPVIVIEADDVKAAELSLIENLQREDLSPLEEAAAFSRMLEEYDYSQETLGEIIGKSRSYISNNLRLLNLTPAETEALTDGVITAGHARALLSVKEAESRCFLLEEIEKKNLSVRQTEDLARRLNSVSEEKRTVVKRQTRRTSSFQREMEERLRRRFGTKVKIKNRAYGGCIEIDYYSDEDLNRILDLVIEEEASLVKE